ncbi:MAG: peptidoglycan-binding protein [Pseudomonadota bacterium]
MLQANPMKGSECRSLWRDYQTKNGYRSFASTRNKTGCSWTGGYSTQAKADQEALRRCRSYGSCYILTNTTIEADAKRKVSEAKKIQTALNKLGFNVGKVDGIIGPGTRAQIKKYQKSIGQSQTGKLTSVQVRVLEKAVETAKLEAQTTPQRLASYPLSANPDLFEIDADRTTLIGVQTGTRVRVWDALSAKLLFKSSGPYTDAAVDQSAERMIFARTGDVPQVLDMSNGKLSSLPGFREASQVAITRDGGQVALLSPGGLGVSLHDAKTGTERGQFRLPFAADDILYAQVGPLFIVSKSKGIVQVQFDGSVIPILPKPTQRSISTYRFSPNGKALAVGYTDGTMSIYRSTSIGWEEIKSTQLSGEINALDIHDGRREVAIWVENKWQVYDANSLKPKGSYGQNAFKKNDWHLSFVNTTSHIIRSGSAKADLLGRNGRESLAYKKKSFGYNTAAKRRITQLAAWEKSQSDALVAAKTSAKTLFDQRDCAGFAQTDPAHRDGRTVEACEDLQRAEQLAAEIKTALSQGDCARAAELDANDQAFGAEIAQCKADAEERFLRAVFAQAQADGDCSKLSELERRLGEKGAASACKFNTALGSDSARRMYLAAAGYDAANERARARLLYTTLMEKFPEDDLALQAAMRLTALNDIARSEKAQAAMEAEVAKLRKKAADAKRAAERARKDAANAQRVRVQQAQKPPSPCRHLAAGQGIRYTIPSSGAFDAFIKFSDYGSEFVILNLNHHTGWAHLRSLGTGKLLDVRCSNL